MKPLRGDFARSLLRTFAGQGSWNYRSLVAGGLTYALLPLLRRVHAGDPVSLRDAVARHLTSFNAHPYLTPLAVGALARLEHEGRPPEMIRRFRSALSGSLGAVGDRLVWTGWRPVCLLCGVLAYSLGAEPWTAILIFLVPYNAGHLLLRVWAFRTGWHAGIDVADRLSADALKRAGRWLAGAGALLAGVAAGAAAMRLAGGGMPGPAVGAAAGLAGLAAHRAADAGGITAVGVVAALAAAALLG